MNEKKVTLVISPKNFQDEEYFVVKEELEKEGIKTMTASSKMGQAIGMNGGVTIVDKKLADIVPESYDGLIFIGGTGTLKYLDNKDSSRIINKALLSQKIIGAICIAPLLLARAGILKGKRATVWASSLNRTAVRGIKEEGGIYLDQSVVQDGDIITGNGPSAAIEFAQAIISSLTER
jgi:protease I